MNIDLSKLSIKTAHKHLVHGDFSAKELAQAVVDSIAAKDGDIHAYLEVYDDAIAHAEKAQKMIDSGDANFLTGIPIAVKDNILVKGKRASAASKILEHYTAPYSATAIKRLGVAGSVFVGRTNMDEFAMGSSTEKSAYGPTKNPLDLTRVPGGSSGGSAAAVAMNSALASLGSDTAGSVRQPAAFCGVVGLKPTYGAVSRHGLIALGSSLDQIGPVTKTVTDSEIIFNCIRGGDALDSTTIPDAEYATRREGGLKKRTTLTIGVPWHLVNGEGIDADVRENFKAAVAKMEKMGYAIEEIKLPNVAYSLPAYYILLPAEASSNLSRFDGMKYGLNVPGKDLLEDYMRTRGQGFGPEPRRRILLGTYVLSAGYYDAYYNKAQAVRRLIAQDFAKAFETVDAIVTPTTPSPAFKLGEKMSDPVSMYLADVFTVPANIANIPTISVPCGTVPRDGVELPLGLQFSAPMCREDILFRAGKEFLGEEV